MSPMVFKFLPSNLTYVWCCKMKGQVWSYLHLLSLNNDTGALCHAQSHVLKSPGGGRGKGGDKTGLLDKPQLFQRSPSLSRTWMCWKSYKTLHQPFAGFPPASLPSLLKTKSYILARRSSGIEWCGCYWCHVTLWGDASSACKIRPLSCKSFQLLVFAHRVAFRDNQIGQCSAASVSTYRMILSLINMQDGKTDHEGDSLLWKTKCKQKYVYAKEYFIHGKQCCMKKGRDPNSETSEEKLPCIWSNH